LLPPELHDVLRLLRMECSPVGAVKSPSMHCRRKTARLRASKQLRDAAQTDADGCGQLKETEADIQMLYKQVKTPKLSNGAIGMDINECVWSGVLSRTSISSGLEISSPLNKLLSKIKWINMI